MASFEDMIKTSGCFGLAYDGTVKECRICEVRLKCESKCRMGQVSKPAPVQIATPIEVNTVEEVKSVSTVPVIQPEDTKKVKKPAPPIKAPNKKEKVVEKPPVQYAADMPNFRGFSMEELENMAIKRGCDMKDLEKYVVPNIRRMRLTMAIKKTYEIAS